MTTKNVESKQSTTEAIQLSLSDKDLQQVVDIKKKEEKKEENPSVDSSSSIPEQVKYFIPAEKAKIIPEVAIEMRAKGLYAVTPTQLDALVNSNLRMFGHLVSLEIHMATVNGYMVEKSRIINEIEKTGVTVELTKRLVDNELALIKAKQSRDAEHQAKTQGGKTS